MTLSNDQPIATPSDDRFGLDPFAAAIAKSIASMAAPAGVVLAVNGAWGTGKSSAINLIRHHLQAPIDAGYIVIVPFNPWWFAGADTLTLAFFQELNKAIGPSLPKTARKSLANLGRCVSAVGAVAGALANLKAPGLGELIESVAGLVGRLSSNQRTVDQEHKDLSNALSEQKKRFLVIIDDIDRLSPDDALTIFRLVKSVGRLPNVIYLLAFDRAIAERIVAERFPTEGPSYLEKIIQGAFELPPPLVDVLRQQVVEAAVQVMGEPGEQQRVRFWNVFYDVVAPYIRTPRDVTRIANHLAITWPAVAGNVDRADFLALATLQVFDAALYSAIREHPSELCGAGDRVGQRPQDIAEHYDNLMGIATRPERERPRLRGVLQRLFPRLDSVWANVWHGDGSDWRRERLIASAENFQSYFAFAPSEDVIPAERIEALITRADDRDYVATAFREALARRRRNGSTSAALLLEELTVRARDIDANRVGALTATLFALGDELDVEADVVRGFGMGNNQLRLHWLFNVLVTERFEDDERDRIYRDAMADAALHWAVNFAERCIACYQPRDGKLHEPLVSQQAAAQFRTISLEKIAQSVENGSIITHPRINLLMFAWSRLAPDGAAHVRSWTDEALDHDAFVIAMARAIPSESWSRSMGIDSMGDRVGRRSVRVDLRPYEQILDVERFETRVNQLIDAGSRSNEDVTVLRHYRDLQRGGHGD
ncbi:KAP family P-loop NTPase fold protein [Defluviicoccus vanus]|uniref:NTPase n=1 Tax=Defluviicoccus vanus TaxID=111831 RepID=A0A7H1N448_9PROT|nr:P-loop NTPase fold protein [Defluviicoccus vanus]QNT70484.1 NTPase [Defluviicoccus vanus]